MEETVNRLFVGGLTYEATQDTLRAFVSGEGFEVVDAFIVRDKETQHSKGFGFVTLSAKENQDAAIKALNGRVLDGRKLTVNKANPKAPRK